MRIFILEDNADRRTAMVEQIADCLPMFGISFFETSESMIIALKSTTWNEVALISLDNDLEPVQVNGHFADAGDGLAVAGFLLGENSPVGNLTVPLPPLKPLIANEPISMLAARVGSP